MVSYDQMIKMAVSRVSKNEIIQRILNRDETVIEQLKKSNVKHGYNFYKSTIYSGRKQELYLYSQIGVKKQSNYELNICSYGLLVGICGYINGRYIDTCLSLLPNPAYPKDDFGNTTIEDKKFREKIRVALTNDE